MLSSNVGHYVPAAERGTEPYVGLRLLAGLLSVLAVLVVIVGGLIALLVVLGSLGSAGAAARLAPGAVTAGIAGAGLVGGLLITLATVFYGLVLWGASQAIHVILSIEGHAREGAALQRAMLAELRRISSTSPPSR
jgi:hypothetical protein